MKNLLKSTSYLFFAALLVFSACQVEQVVIKDPSGKTLDNMSPLADLVVQTTMNDGSADNIIDHASCISVILPVTVIANGVELVIATADDFKLIEREFDKDTTDTDVLEITFPIHVTLADFTVLEVATSGALNDLAEACIEGGSDDDIECVDIKYPISISVYNADNQVTDIITFNNDEELHEYIEHMEDNTVFSFEFPITMVLSDGTETVVNSNEAMENLIDDVSGTCDEDDDDDYNDDDVDNSEINDVLMSTAWEITYFYNLEDHTNEFDSMVLAFIDDHLAVAEKGDLRVEGDWETYGDDGSLEMELEFDGDYPFDLLHEDWIIDSYTADMIELSYMNEDSTYRYLTFGATDNSVTPQPTVAEYIVQGDWVIASYMDAGMDETANYTGFSISFASDLSLNVTDGTDTITGEWEEVMDSESHQMVLYFGTVIPFDKLNEEWDVVSFTDDRVELTRMDSSTETTETLVFEKL